MSYKDKPHVVILREARKGLQRALTECESLCREFEKAYGYSTEEMRRRVSSGEMDHDGEINVWLGADNRRKHILRRLEET